MMAIGVLLVPVFLLLLFVGRVRRTLRAGLGAAAPAGGHYIDSPRPRNPRITGRRKLPPPPRSNVCIGHE